MALTGSLNSVTKIVKEKDDGKEVEKEVEVSIYDSNIKYPELLQVLFFIFAISATICYAIVLTNSETEQIMQESNTKPEIRVIRESTYTIKDSIKVDTLGLNIIK